MATFPAALSSGWRTPLLSSIQQMATFNVLDFGALADGTTDNASAINSAITSANTLGGGTVLVPAAALPFATGSAIVRKANVALCVMGTIKALASHTGAGIAATDVSNVEVFGSGTIDMNKAATTNGGVVGAQQGIFVKASAGAVSRIRIRDVTIQNGWKRGVEVSSSVLASPFSDVVIDHVTVTTVGADGIYIAGVGATSPTISTHRDICVTRCIVTNPGAQGIQALGVSDLHIDANVVADSGSATGHGICIGAGSLGSTTDHVTDFTVTANKIRGFVAASQWGIVVSARCIRFSVADNAVRSCRSGITIDVTDPNNPTSILDTDGSVTGNSVQGSTASHGINVGAATSLVLTANTCRGNAGTGIAVSASTGVTVTGNTTKSNSGAGIALFGTATGVGGHKVTGNVSTGNSAGNYYSDATPVVSTIDAAAEASLVAQQSFSNTTTETTQFTYAIPANRDQAGTTYRITLGYVVDNVATSGSLTLRLYGWGGGILLASVVIPSQVGAATNQPIFLDYLLTVRNIGASGRIMVMGNLRSEFSALSKAFGGIVSTAVDTSLGTSLLCTAQWATASASNVCRLELAAVEQVKS